MISELSSVTSDLITKLLDTSMLRHKIISNNIANANVNGYKSMEVNFETLMRAELKGTSQLHNNDRLESALNFVEPEISERIGTSIDSDKTTLDMEMAEMAKNTLKFESLIKARSLQSGIVSMAISGRRN